MFFETLYDIESKHSYIAQDAAHSCADLVNAFELAPGALNVLKVQKIYQPKPSSAEATQRKREWRDQAEKLQSRAVDPTFPKPTWLIEKLPHKTHEERVAQARAKREREEVLWHLLCASHRDHKLPNVSMVRVFHGCPKLDIAQSIFRNGFAANVQKTKGWFGEGIYTSTSAPYALRYALGMRDFWDKPGQTGYVIAGRAVFVHVYPVTQQDNDSPLKPALKGHRIAAPESATGCDAHYVNVRGHPPNEDYVNRTYHACCEGERPDGNELVVGQESQILPEYIVEVRVCGDDNGCEFVRLAAEHWGRSPADIVSSCAPSSVQNSMVTPKATVNGPLHKNSLQTYVQRRLGRPTKPQDIRYTEDNINGEFISSVQIPELSEQLFEGTPQPRRIAAQQSAARAALEALETSTTTDAPCKVQRRLL